MMRILFFLSFAVSQVSLAQDLNIRGFYTVGVSWVDSDNKDFLYLQQFDNKADVSQLTRLGLNLQAPLVDDWTFHGQVLAKQRAEDGTLKADWMFLSYQPDENITARFGKIKSNQWLISDYIDVGKTYLWASPPEEVYDIFPVKSYNGGSLIYNKDFSGLEFNLEVSTGDYIDEKSTAIGTVALKGENLYAARTSLKYDNYHFRVAYLDLDFSNLVNGETVSKTMPKITSAAFASKWGGTSLIAEGVHLSVPNDVDIDEANLANQALNTAFLESMAAASALEAAKAAEASALANLDRTNPETQTAYNTAVAQRISAQSTNDTAQRNLGIKAAEKAYA